MSRFTAKSKKSRRGRRKNPDKSPQNNITNLFDPNVFPMGGMMSPNGMVPDPNAWTANPLGLNQIFPPGMPPQMMNPMLG